MPRLPPISPPPSTTTLLRTPRILSSRLADRHRLYSRQTTPTTGPNASTPPSKADDNAFNKTGERRGGEEEANRISMVHDEYSKSGGDDAVVEQVKAAFKNATDTDPLSEKATAGRGNVINPLEVSPATPEVSATVEETYVHQNATRAPDAKTGPGITTTRKSKKVEKVEIDFSKMTMRGR